MNIYRIISGIDGYHINGHHVVYISVFAENADEAIERAKKIIDKEYHQYLYMAELLID